MLCRRLRTVVVFLLLGAIVNIAVAWGCVHFFRSWEGEQIGFPSINDAWLASLGWDPSHFTTSTPEDIRTSAQAYHIAAADLQRKPHGWLEQWQMQYFGHDFRRFDWVNSNGSRYTPVACQYRAGWPLPALYGDCSIDQVGPAAGPINARRRSYDFRYVWRSKDATKRVAAMTVDFKETYPLLPLWPGFAINTIFYAAILWALIAGPGTMRRYFRARRALCPACAYPIGSSEVCTECGTPVAPRTT